MGEEQKEVCARCCFSAPVCSYSVRSWCNRWLTCSSTTGEVSFVSCNRTLASRLLLLPQTDGRYKVQLLFGEAKPLFLSVRDRAVQMSSDCSDAALLFTLQLDEHGRVSLSAGGGFLSTDRNGCFRTANSSTPRKWELFTLFEHVVKGYPEEAPWVVQAPVRVTLQASNGKFLCASKPVVGARAEVPCCCEEFLMDLWFSSLPPPKTGETQHAGRSFLRALFGHPVKEEQAVPSKNSHCTIRTADGACLLTAGPDGNVFTTHVNRALGRETFSVNLHADSACPRISVQQVAAERRYLSAEYGHLVNRRVHRRACDYFNIQLANGSRVLLRSIHGGFLGAYSGSLRTRCFCDEKQAFETIGAWNLRSHGDSYYTLTSASTMKRGADIYMFADSSGHVYQSSNPRVHFPAVASLFEIKPVSNAGIMPKSSSTSIIGFTIRTARKINGKQRYLSVEPNGSIRAVKLNPSRWELFQLIDVDATSAAAAPQKFCCVPASFNRQPPPAHGPVLSRVSLPVNRVTATDQNKTASVVKACEVAALAVTGGQAVPKKSPASLQELCITQVCCHAAGILTEDQPYHKASFPEAKVPAAEDEFSELVSALCSLARSHDLLPVNIPSEFAENSFNIPDDLLTRIWSTCRSRQVPKDSCKWLPSAFVPQSQAPRFGPRTQRPTFVEGWHCSSCDQGNVLPMEAAVNPAHHRYLEVYSRAIHSTGVLWNLISLAGVSIMSTALFCQLKAVAGRRSSSQNSF